MITKDVYIEIKPEFEFEYYGYLMIGIILGEYEKDSSYTHIRSLTKNNRYAIKGSEIVKKYDFYTKEEFTELYPELMI
jgi:hypothetical protein